MLAREFGFADWARFIEYIGVMRESEPLLRHADPPFYIINLRDRHLRVHRPQSAKNWETVERVFEHLVKLPRLREIELEGLQNVTRRAATLFPTSVDVVYHE